jgi:hypothetical protein
MAGKYGSPSVTVTLDDAQGGSGQVITNFVLELGGAKITANTEPSTAFGDSWEENLPTALRRAESIAIAGHWDTTATTGPHAVMADVDDDPNGGTRTLVIVFGDSKTFTVEGFIVEYEVVAAVGALTRFNALFLPSGAGTWS